MDDGLEERISKNLQLGSGPSWLPSDMIGTTFNFEKDRDVGIKKIQDMVKLQITYFTFLMNRLPVEADNYDNNKQPDRFNQSMCLQCDGAENGQICYDRRIEAGIFYFYNLLINDSLKNTNANIPTLRYSAKRDYVPSDIPGVAINLINRLASISKSPATMNNIQKSVISDGDHLAYICFPMGNQVPLRMTPLSIDDIKLNGANWSISFPNTLYRDMFAFPSMSKTLPESKVNTPDCMKYKFIANYPIEVFGWKKNTNEQKYMNDLMCDYCYYLTNTQTTYEEFNFPIPSEPETGESGNIKPPRCLEPGANCAEWELQGFDSYDDWIKWITDNQITTLTEEDIALISTIDIVEDTKELFLQRYIDYGKNPEFMPNYEQIPQWRFSNACQDELKYQKAINNKLYFTEDSYNFVVSLLVQKRWQAFVKEVNETTFQVHGHSFKLLGADFKPEDLLDNEATKRIFFLLATLPDGSLRIFPGEMEIIRQINKETNSQFYPGKEIYTERKSKFFQLIEKYYLLPESFIGENQELHYITTEQVGIYFVSISTVYKDALKIIASFNEEPNTSDKPKNDCLMANTKFEGIGMTTTQQKQYKEVLVGIFGFDWDLLAKGFYNSDLSEFNTIANDREWVASHPIGAWFRDTFYKKFIIPMMDCLVYAAPVLDVAISIALVATGVGTVFVGLVNMSMILINTAWQTMAPPGSVFHHDKPLTDAQIGTEFGIQIGIFLALEGAGAVIHAYGNTFVRMCAQSYGWIAGKTSKFLAGMIESAESSLTRLAARNAATIKYFYKAFPAEGGFFNFLAGMRKAASELEVLQKALRVAESDARVIAAKATRNAAKSEFENAQKLVQEALAAQKGTTGAEFDAASELTHQRQIDFLKIGKKLNNMENEVDNITSIVNNELEAIPDKIAALEKEIAIFNKNMEGLAKGAEGIGKDLSNLVKKIETTSTNLTSAKNTLVKSKDEIETLNKLIEGFSDSSQYTEEITTRYQKAVESFLKAEEDIPMLSEDLVAATYTAEMLSILASRMPTDTVYNAAHYTFQKNFFSAITDTPMSIIEKGLSAAESKWGIPEVAVSSTSIIQILTNFFGLQMTGGLPAPPPMGESPNAEYPLVPEDAPNIQLEIELLRLKVDYIQPWQDAWVVCEAWDEAYFRHNGFGDEMFPDLWTAFVKMTKIRDNLLEKYKSYYFALSKRFNTDIFTEDYMAAQAAAWGDKPGAFVPPPPPPPVNTGDIVITPELKCDIWRKKWYQDGGLEPKWGEIPVECRTAQDAQNAKKDWERSHAGEPLPDDIANFGK